MGDYLNAVVSAGFMITAIGEPQPSLAACEAVPRFVRWRNLGAFSYWLRRSGLHNKGERWQVSTP